MKALVAHSPGDIGLESVPEPEINEYQWHGEVRLRCRVKVIRQGVRGLTDEVRSRGSTGPLKPGVTRRRRLLVPHKPFGSPK